VQINLEVVLHLVNLSPNELISVGNQCFAELGSAMTRLAKRPTATDTSNIPVERRHSLLADHHNLALEPMLPQALHGVVPTSTTSNQDNGLFASLGIRFRDRPLVRLQRRTTVLGEHVSHACSDEDLAILLSGVKLVQRVETGGIFDVAGAEVEACGMPTATQGRLAVVLSEYTLYQWCAVMSAVCTGRELRIRVSVHAKDQPDPDLRACHRPWPRTPCPSFHLLRIQSP
jgi:hypothetical protein